MTSDYERRRRKFLRHHGGKAVPVAIVCTNRGAHKRVSLASVTVFTDEGVAELADVLLLRTSGSGSVVPANTSDPLVGVPRTGERTAEALNRAGVWEFSCPKCSRTPRVTKALIVGAGSHGMKVIDVSYHE